ncbi:hypothetical protein D3C72_2408750 [compost metagenome]
MLIVLVVGVELVSEPGGFLNRLQNRCELNEGKFLGFGGGVHCLVSFASVEFVARCEMVAGFDANYRSRSLGQQTILWRCIN